MNNFRIIQVSQRLASRKLWSPERELDPLPLSYQESVLPMNYPGDLLILSYFHAAA